MACNHKLVQLHCDNSCSGWWASATCASSHYEYWQMSTFRNLPTVNSWTCVRMHMHMHLAVVSARPVTARLD